MVRWGKVVNGGMVSELGIREGYCIRRGSGGLGHSGQVGKGTESSTAACENGENYTGAV